MQAKQECRYCLSDDNRSEMVDPCDCEGTMKFVHQKCLQEWVENGNRQVFTSKTGIRYILCEICKSKMKYRRQYKYGLLYGIMQLVNWIFTSAHQACTLTAHSIIAYFLLKRLKLIYYDVLSAAKEYFSLHKLHSDHHDVFLKLIHNATVLASVIATIYDIANYYTSIVKRIRCPEFIFCSKQHNNININYY